MEGIPQVAPIELVVAPAENLMELFHQINSIIPEIQIIEVVAYETHVREAIEIMQAKHYSQLPVRAGNRVLGMFSYRSFSVKALEITEQVDLGALPVGLFMEAPSYVFVQDDFNSSLWALEEKDVVLVGQPDSLQGIITPMDLVKYLYLISSPFVLLGEIELAVRRIIQICTTEATLREIITITLSEKYKDEDLPQCLEELTFNDYVQIIGYGRTWHYFEKVFVGGDFQRKRARAKLEELRDLRNDVFHFKRTLAAEDIEKLQDHREWLKNLLAAYQVRMEG